MVELEGLKSEMQTIRRQITELLCRDEYSAREISQEVSIREKEVYDHLSHISRSLIPKKRQLLIIPSECLVCGYNFESRKRFRKPGRCPRCKSERIEVPRYRVVGKS